MRTEKIVRAGFFILMMAGFVSCGNAMEARQVPEEPVDSYRVEREAVVDLDEMSLPECYVTERHIYYIEENGIWMRELAQETEPVCVCPPAENEILLTFTMTGAGNVIAAVRDREQGRTWLRKTDQKGKVIWESEFPERQEDFHISHILEGSDGKIYAASSQELFLWSMSGKLERCLTVRGELIQQLADAGEGRLAVLQYRQKGQTLTVYQGADGKEVFQKDFRTGRRWFDGGLYYPADSVLAQYHWDSDSSQPVLDFTDCGVIVSDIRLLRSLGEKRFLIGCAEEGGEGIRFAWLTADEEGHGETGKEEKNRTQLVIATFNPQNLQASIVRFNRSQEEYEMITKDFGTVDTEDLYAYIGELDRFNACISSAGAPDLIDINGTRNYHDYVDRGYLLDLTDYIGESGKIRKDDILPRVWEDMAVDGKLYTMPRVIEITALACPTELLDGKTSWTIEDYLELLERYPNALSGNGASVERVKKDILRKALYEGINGFVDWEEGKAFLDGEEFRSLLRRIEALEIEEISLSRKEMAREGETVFWELYLHRVNELLQAEYYSGQELTLIGFPVSGGVEGERSRNHISYSEMLGIHSASGEKEAAWEYVEEYMTGALQKSDFLFRTGKEAFEERMQEDVGVETFTLDGLLPPSTQEEADKVRRAFEEGVYYPAQNKLLLDIIEEEAGAYFGGDRELDDVVDIIQSRIQVYLSENG